MAWQFLTFLYAALSLGIRVFKERIVEETNRRDFREVEDEVANGDAMTRRQSRLGLEDSVREVLYGEVRIWVDQNERLQQAMVLYTAEIQSTVKEHEK